MIITLTPDIEHTLTAEAQKRGCNPEQLALDSLRAHFHLPDIPPTVEQATLADFLRGHVGVLHSSEHAPGGARLSEDSSQKFTAGLLAQSQRKLS
jgi:hypothetical protein